MKVKAFKYLILVSFGFLSFGWFYAQTEISSADISFSFVSKDVEGTIEGFQSQSVIFPDDLSRTNFSGSVAVESLKTGNFLRDWSLKSSKYFDEDEYPTIDFRSTEIAKTNEGYKVTGALTMKGNTNSIEIDFSEKDGQLKGTTSLYTSDYGIQIKSKREDNLVRVEILLMLTN